MEGRSIVYVEAWGFGCGFVRVVGRGEWDCWGWDYGVLGVIGVWGSKVMGVLGFGV